MHMFARPFDDSKLTVKLWVGIALRFRYTITSDAAASGGYTATVIGTGENVTVCANGQSCVAVGTLEATVKKEVKLPAQEVGELREGAVLELTVTAHAISNCS